LDARVDGVVGKWEGVGGRGWRKLPKDEQKMMKIFSWNWRNLSEDE